MDNLCWLISEVGSGMVNRSCVNLVQCCQRVVIVHWLNYGGASAIIKIYPPTPPPVWRAL